MNEKEIRAAAEEMVRWYMGWDEGTIMIADEVELVNKICTLVERERERRGFLGIANCWKEPPSVIDECKRLGHKRFDYTIRRCYQITGCKECGYWYEYDCS